MVDCSWVPYGTAVVDGVADAVSAAQRDGPLAPCTVITPDPATAVALRRELAGRRPTGGVSFHSVEGLATAVLAAVGARVQPPAGELVVAAVRAVLADAPGTFAPVATHRGTHTSIAATLADAAAAGATPASLDDSGAVAADLGRIWREVERRVGPVGPGAITVAAIRALASLSPQATVALERSLGPVLVVVPDHAGSATIELLAALDRVVPVTVALGATGDADVDAATAASWRRLDPSLEAPAVLEPPPTPTRILAANDIDDEVRTAVRELLAAAEAGTPWDRMAIAHPSTPPYPRTVVDVLTRAGIPYRASSPATLGERLAGRLLGAVLAVAEHDFARTAVVDLWSIGVVVDADGAPVPASEYDHRTRRLGIIGGRDQWRQRLAAGIDTLDACIADLATREAELAGAGEAERDGDDSAAARLQRRREGAERRRREVAAVATDFERLAELAAAVPARWGDVAGWADQVVATLAGGCVGDRWSEDETRAAESIRREFAALATLDAVDAAPEADVVVATIRAVLERTAPRRAGATGVRVTTIDTPTIVGADVAAVVGLVEGHLPLPGSVDPLLGDAGRARVGLPSRREAVAAQQRSLHATLAGATTRIVSTARHDQRSGRSLVPSRWFLDAVEAVTGVRPDTEAVMGGADIALGHGQVVTTVASHRAGLVRVADGAVPALSASERALAALVVGGSVEGNPAADDVVAHGAAVSRARRAETMTRYDGDVSAAADGDEPVIDITTSASLSPTSLETYARCPRRWFFEKALHLSEVDRPEALERIDPRTRGTLVHRILERVIGDAVDTDAIPPPGEDWSPAQRARAQEVTAEECGSAEALGLTGHPRWWEIDRAEISWVVDQALSGDARLRAELGVVPIAVEFTFGRDAGPPLTLELSDGRQLALSGQADRVDVGSGRVVVWDYKFASKTPFEVLDKDPERGGDRLGFGAKLQLCTYGLAAAGRFDAGGDTDAGGVIAAYWFLSPRSINQTVGYTVDDGVRRSFVRTVEVLADGIAAGSFPAKPGEHQFHRGNFENCTWCEFDRICPADRDAEWERVRLRPRLQRYRTLVEDGSHALDPGAPGGGS